MQNMANADSIIKLPYFVSENLSIKTHLFLGYSNDKVEAMNHGFPLPTTRCQKHFTFVYLHVALP